MCGKTRTVHAKKKGVHDKQRTQECFISAAAIEISVAAGEEKCTVVCGQLHPTARPDSQVLFPSRLLSPLLSFFLPAEELPPPAFEFPVSVTHCHTLASFFFFFLSLSLQSLFSLFPSIPFCLSFVLSFFSPSGSLSISLSLFL